MQVLGRVPVPLELRFSGYSAPFQIQPLVLKHLSMPLNLSGPFLRKMGIDQIHSQNALRVQGTLVKLLPPQKKPSSRDSRPVAVYTVEAVTIPANTQVWTRCKIPAVESGAIRPAEGLMEGSAVTEETYGVHSLRAAIVPVHGDSVPVPFLNTTDQPITVPAGVKYGHLVPQPTEGPGIYNIANEQPSQEDDTVPAWKRGPTTKANYEQRCNHLRSLFQLDQNPLLKDPKDLAKLLAVLIRNYEVFSHDGEYGRTDVIKHDIQLVPGARPIRCANRPVNPALEENLKRQVLKWLKHGVVEPAQSPWAFPLVPVKKKSPSGEMKIRWCIDYRKLNAVTVPDAYSIGDPNHNLAQLSRSTVFSTIDASGAFHQISIEENKREMTAFSTPFGQFQFCQMPFGVINGPSTYARLISRVLEGIPPSIALGYVDDVLVHARTLDEHADGLDRVLTAHRKAGLRLNPDKCHFAQPKVEYLGHAVSAQGIEPIPAYTELVQNWPLPTTRTALRSFLGKVNYYRRFIRNFAARAAPLLDRLSQDGTKDKATFTPSPQYEDAFYDLRSALLSAPILGHPRFNDPNARFIVDTDWSAINAAIGGVLSQVQDGQERVIAYGGARLPESRTRYAPQKGELFALLHFVNKWSYFLRYQPFVVRTDHSSLTYLKTMNHPDFMVQRWLATLANFQFTVEYRKGARHGNADGLSRATHLPAFSGEPITDESLNLCNAIHERVVKTTGLNSPQEARKKQLEDAHLRPLLQGKAHDSKPFDLPTSSPWVDAVPTAQVRGGVLYDIRGRLLIPPACQEQVVKTAHEVMGHRGPKATKHRLAQAAVFPTMPTIVRNVLSTCHACQTKSKPTQQRTTLRPSTSRAPFETWAMDFVGPLPTSTKGFRYILTLRDVFTRWVEAFPTKDMTAATVIHHLVTDVFPRFGLPLKLHSDNGSQFTSTELHDVCRALGIKKTETPPYNPKSNMVERFHRDLMRALTALTQDCPRSWPECLPLVLQAARAAPSEATGISPFAATFGRDPPTDVALFFPFPKEKEHFRDLTDFAMDLRQKTQRVHDMIASATKAAILARTARYRGQLKSFPIGSQVYLFTPVTPPHASSKFANVYWSGPHEIVEQINDLTYKLRSSTGRLYTASIDRLRPYHSGPNEDLHFDESATDVTQPRTMLRRPHRQRQDLSTPRHDDEDDDPDDVDPDVAPLPVPTSPSLGKLFVTPPSSPSSTGSHVTPTGSGSSDPLEDFFSPQGPESSGSLEKGLPESYKLPDSSESEGDTTSKFMPTRTSTEQPHQTPTEARAPPPKPSSLGMGRGRGRGRDPTASGGSPALPTRNEEVRSPARSPPPPPPARPGLPVVPFRLREVVPKPQRAETAQQREYREMLDDRARKTSLREEQSKGRAARAQARALARGASETRIPSDTGNSEGKARATSLEARASASAKTEENNLS